MVILYEVHEMSVRVHILSKTNEGRNESFGQSLA